MGEYNNLVFVIICHILVCKQIFINDLLGLVKSDIFLKQKKNVSALKIMHFNALIIIIILV